MKKSPVLSERQLAEFDSFWLSDGYIFFKPGERGRHFPIVGSAFWKKSHDKRKAEVLEYYTWLWEGAGYPKRFLPNPEPHNPVTFGSGRVDTEDKLANFDQDLYPNKDWNL